MYKISYLKTINSRAKLRNENLFRTLRIPSLRMQLILFLFQMSPSEVQNIILTTKNITCNIYDSCSELIIRRQHEWRLKIYKPYPCFVQFSFGIEA